MDLTLTSDELDVFNNLIDCPPTAAVPADGSSTDPYKRVRAGILRRVILQQPVIREMGADPKKIKVPPSGLYLRHIEIVGDTDEKDRYDFSAALHLEDACTEEGHPLPPLALRDCIFHQAIYMSGAKFRNLDFKGSQMTRLKATNLNVDGNLNLAGISSSQKKEELEPIKFEDVEESVIGTQKVRDSDFFIDEAFKECLPNEVVRRLEPDEVGRFRYGYPYVGESPHQPLCWIELRNAHIGVDIDVSGSTLVCPAAKLEMINSPHARYALDLRGSTINGRLTWSPDFRNPLKTPKQFEALGGVSIVRSRIAGSVCGSGGILTAVEGCAFAAQRADIRGHVFLDFSWEGVLQWHRFEAEGFVDLTNATLGSSLFMAGARLGEDRWRRSGLIASEATIGLNCKLSAIERMDDVGGLVEFQSGGVRMDDATVRGSLNMNGARLSPDSFGDAMYAPGMTVNGIAEFSVLEHSRKEDDWRSFTASGPVFMVGATFRKTVSFSGADLSLDSGHARNRSKECALQLELAHIQSTAYFLHFKRVKHPEASPLRTTIKGALTMRRAQIGMNLRLSGLSIDVRMTDDKGKSDPYNRSIALDLSSAHINGILFMNAYDPRKGEVAAAEPLFDVKGSVLLNQATIGDEVYLEGAKVESLTDEKWGIKAYAMSAASKVGAYRPVNWNQSGNTPLLHVIGGIDLSHATIPRGLYLIRAEVHAADPDDPEHLKSNLMALQGAMGNINTVEITDSTFNGQLCLKNLTASQGIKTKKLTIKRGALDLLQGNLGFLDLTDFDLVEPNPRIFDRTGGEPDDDALHLRSARIAGNLTITCPPTPRPSPGLWLVVCLVEGLERSILRLYRRSKKATEADRPVVARGLHWIWRRLCKCVGIKMAKRAVHRPKPYFANLRETDIGGLKDDEGKGWGTLRLKLEGFVCRRSPVRKLNKVDRPRLGLSGWWYTFLQNAHHTRIGFLMAVVCLFILEYFLWHQGITPWRLFMAAAVAIGVLSLLTLVAGIVYWHFHMADAHVTWLNLQYVDPKAPEIKEFTPSAYDQLARALREDGHDRESKRILSAKFRVKQKVDVALISKPFWMFYHHGFDYGLSSLAAGTTLLLCMAIGCGTAIYLGHREDALLVKSESRSPEITKPGVDIQRSTAQRALANSQPPGRIQDKTQRVRHEKCDPADASLYAMELFIPVIHFGEARTCMIRPDDPPKLEQSESVFTAIYNSTATEKLRFFEFLYVVFGWIVTSITLLTIPGILRSRADG